MTDVNSGVTENTTNDDHNNATSQSNITDNGKNQATVPLEVHGGAPSSEAVPTAETTNPKTTTTPGKRDAGITSCEDGNDGEDG